MEKGRDDVATRGKPLSRTGETMVMNISVDCGSCMMCSISPNYCNEEIKNKLLLLMKFCRESDESIMIDGWNHCWNCEKVIELLIKQSKLLTEERMLALEL